MGRIYCTVMRIDKFGNTPHAGFQWFTDDGKPQQGWMPLLFVETMTGVVGNAFDKNQLMPV